MFSNGGWILFGFSIFFIIEKVFPDDDDDDDNECEVVKEKRGVDKNNNKEAKSPKNKPKTDQRRLASLSQSIRVMGILNLMANIIDNFTHGIAVAGSFQASLKVSSLR